jgi:hypothetical protein
VLQVNVVGFLRRKERSTATKAIGVKTSAFLTNKGAKNYVSGY